MKKIPTLFILLTLAATLSAQTYPFIQYKENQLLYADRSENLAKFFDRWERMEATGLGNINIVHIGGSHVQAGTMSNAIRQRLMHSHPHLVGGRGLLFPYAAAARCNNPADYRVHCPQKVILTRNIYKEYPQPLGLCGISVTASDSLTEVGIVLRDSTVNYATRRIIVLGHSEQGVVLLRPTEPVKNGDKVF